MLFRTAVVVVGNGFSFPDEIDYVDIAAKMLEHHVNELTEESSEVNAIHDPVYQV